MDAHTDMSKCRADHTRGGAAKNWKGIYCIPFGRVGFSHIQNIALILAYACNLWKSIPLYLGMLNNLAGASNISIEPYVSGISLNDTLTNLLIDSLNHLVIRN